MVDLNKICRYCNNVAITNSYNNGYLCNYCNIECKGNYIKILMGDDWRDYVIKHQDGTITVSICWEQKHKIVTYKDKLSNITINEAKEIYKKIKNRFELSKIIL